MKRIAAAVICVLFVAVAICPAFAQTKPVGTAKAPIAKAHSATGTTLAKPASVTKPLAKPASKSTKRVVTKSSSTKRLSTKGKTRHHKRSHRTHKVTSTKAHTTKAIGTKTLSATPKAPKPIVAPKPAMTKPGAPK